MEPTFRGHREDVEEALVRFVLVALAVARSFLGIDKLPWLGFPAELRTAA